jgi:hypothetical protein
LLQEYSIDAKSVSNGVRSAFFIDLKDSNPDARWD